ncbi:MAG TPA: F0F1 ATP synthase subunit A [Candidatus Acidoferrum sp.]|nr:F0F1 ATP synthase subunit A [Candidatus Acidoferrum sp.]
MEENLSPITHLVNHYLGLLALTILQFLHIQPENPDTPIPQHVVMGALVVIFVMVLALILRSRLSVEKPGAMQQVAEMLITNPMRLGIQDILDEGAGKHARSYIYVIGTISLFILFSNLFSLFPLFSAPTGNVTVPLACATIVFLYFNWQGIRHHGPLKYLAHFAAGTKWWIAWLIMPVEIISTLARVLSLTVRLYANIFASDMIYVLFLSLLAQTTTLVWDKSPVGGVLLGIFPALIPLIFIALHILVAFVQTILFTVLPASYLGMATAEEH